MAELKDFLQDWADDPGTTIPSDLQRLVGILPDEEIQLLAAARHVEVPAEEVMPEDLQRLVGVLSDEEIQLLWEKRKTPPAPPPDKSPQQIMAEMKQRAQERCPHKTQKPGVARDRKIRCADCNKVIIGRTQSNVDLFANAVPRDQAESVLYNIDTHAYDGEVGG